MEKKNKPRSVKVITPRAIHIRRSFFTIDASSMFILTGVLAFICESLPCSCSSSARLNQQLGHCNCRGGFRCFHFLPPSRCRWGHNWGVRNRVPSMRLSARGMKEVFSTTHHPIVMFSRSTEDRLSTQRMMSPTEVLRAFSR